MDEIGARLREARMRQKIDINEVEVRTKIRAKYLRAMENEEWDLLPGEVYVRSFLRTYGDFLGLDSRELLDDFRRRYESPSDHEPPPIAPPSRERREREAGRPGRARRGVPPWAIVVVVLIIVAVVLYIVGHKPSQNGAAVSQTKATHTHRSAGTAHTTTTTTHSTTTAPPKPRTVTVSLVATGTVYVCMTDATGKVLIPGRTFTVGEPIPSEKSSKLLLTLGNASVTLKANGKVVPVAASAGAIGLQFTPTGHTALSSSAMPTCTG